MTHPLPVLSGLPLGWSVHTPTSADLLDVVHLVGEHRRSLGIAVGVDAEAVESEIVGRGSWTRRQVLVRDDGGALVAWVCVHDRAAGRANLTLEVQPLCPDGDAVAAALLGWAARVTDDLVDERDVPQAVIDAVVYARDGRQQRWLARSGYEPARTWRQLSRPVEPQEAGAVVIGGSANAGGASAGGGSVGSGSAGSGSAEGGSAEGGVVQHRPGVRVRAVATHADGMPVAEDLRTVHALLEESFADHFNSYRESFPEFISRQREDPGHQWDHWWLAFIDGTDTEDGVPAGALVSTVLPPDSSGAQGSYVDYLGVHARARGRGVAKALLHTVIADAAARGRNRVGLEVDADSPTQADGIYRSLGWETSYITESWHQTRARDADSERSETTP